jgi:hypothetical protein
MLLAVWWAGTACLSWVLPGADVTSADFGAGYGTLCVQASATVHCSLWDAACMQGPVLRRPAS